MVAILFRAHPALIFLTGGIFRLNLLVISFFLLLLFDLKLRAELTWMSGPTSDSKTGFVFFYILGAVNTTMHTR